MFADAARPGETRSGTIARLLRAAQLSGIDPTSNRKFWVCAAAAEILDAGFMFYKDEDEDELREHYSVDLGPSPSLDEVTRFLGCFTDQQEWR